MKPHRFLALAFVFALLAPAAFATPSDPVGSLHLKLLGGSDTIVSLPLHRPALLEARISALNAAQLTLDSAVPSLPSSGAYVLVMSGSLEGALLPVTAATTNTVTVDSAGYDLASLTAGVSGDYAAVIPYWTLDTLFPAGANIYASPSKFTARSQVLLYDATQVGINNAPAQIYFYYAGGGSTPAGWYFFGDTTTPRGDTRLVPQQPFVVRHPTSTADTELLVTGAVPLAGFRVPIATLRANTKQDNLVALPVPVAITLAESKLYESGAFAASPSRFAPTDELLLFDNALVGQNKAPSTIYFYFAGNGSYAAGWYRFGDMSQTVGSLTLHPGEAWIIRKHATTAAETREWVALPSYLQ